MESAVFAMQVQDVLGRQRSVEVESRELPEERNYALLVRRVRKDESHEVPSDFRMKACRLSGLADAQLEWSNGQVQDGDPEEREKNCVESEDGVFDD